MKILEVFTRSKSGEEKLNEDCFIVGSDYVVVADGTTAKGKTPIGESDGRFVARFVCNCLNNISLNLQPLEILEKINEMLSKELQSKNRQGDFASCSIVIFNSVRNELISYGDCRYKVNNIEYGFNKKSDCELAKIRSNVIKQLLRQGKTIEDIKNNDEGRRLIEEKLKEQVKHANQKSEYGYPVLNGKGVLNSFINTIKVKKGDRIILSTDGYPKLLPTLKKTEKNLMKTIKKDPLCINELINTKGVMGENESFDDRTYVRIKV